jgi:hypothetical protein
MFQENTPDLFDNQRVPLAGVAAAHDELRFHGVDMGAGVLDHAIAPSGGSSSPSMAMME